MMSNKKVQSDDISRRLIHNWMNVVMREEGLTAESWAKKAKISPTTITEFISGNRCFLPTTATLTKLAQVVGYSITMQKFGSDDYSEISLADKKPKTVDLIITRPDKGGKQMITKTNAVEVPQTYDDIDDIVCIQIDSDKHSAAGILPGDRVVVNKSVSITAGDTVALYCEKDGLMAALYFPPNLIWADGDYKIKIADLKGEIIGKATDVLRSL
tara:strand:+ start:739 stop:1380 length:642 start_codon:yes stop_codon:yes gene_type:complete